MHIEAKNKETYETPAVEVLRVKMDSAILQMSTEDYKYIDLNG